MSDTPITLTIKGIAEARSALSQTLKDTHIQVVMNHGDIAGYIVPVSQKHRLNLEGIKDLTAQNQSDQSE